MTVQAFFGFTHFPFKNIAPDPARMFHTHTHRTVGKQFENYMELDHGVGLLTGEVGTGKSSLLRFLLHPLATHEYLTVCMNCYPASPRGFLRFLLQKLELKPAFHTELLLHQLQQTLSGFRQQGVTPLFVFDEAQNLPDSVIEQIRLITEFADPPLVILAGPQDFRTRIRRQDLLPLFQRLTFQAVLQSLSKPESRQYIDHHLKTAGVERELFSEDAVNMIFNHTKGVPRMINRICRNALFAAASKEQSQVSFSIVEELVLMDS